MDMLDIQYLPEKKNTTIVLQHVCIIKPSPANVKNNCVVGLINGVIFLVGNYSEQAMKDLVKKAQP